MLSDTLKQQIRAIHQQMKTNLPGYQPRPGQNLLVAEMANILAGSFHSYDRIGLIEAGTGTGKSLAYLMAAIPLALAQKDFNHRHRNCRFTRTVGKQRFTIFSAAQWPRVSIQFGQRSATVCLYSPAQPTSAATRIVYAGAAEPTQCAA